MIPLVHLRITAKHDESVSDEQACVPDSGTWTLTRRGDRIARHATSCAGLNHPQIALHSGAVDEAAHEVDAAIFGGSSIDGGTIARERVGV